MKPSICRLRPSVTAFIFKPGSDDVSLLPAEGFPRIVYGGGPRVARWCKERHVVNYGNDSGESQSGYRPYPSWRKR